MPSHRDVAGAHAMGDRARDLARRLEVGAPARRRSRRSARPMPPPCARRCGGAGAPGASARGARRARCGTARARRRSAPRRCRRATPPTRPRAGSCPRHASPSQLVVDRVGIAVERRRDGRDRELRTGHRGRLQRALLGDRQALDLPLDHGAEPVGDGRRETVRRARRDRPVPAPRAMIASRTREVDDVDDEERDDPRCARWTSAVTRSSTTPVPKRSRR